MYIPVDLDYAVKRELRRRRSYNKIFEVTSGNLSKEVKIRPNNTIVLHANRGEIKYILEVWENNV